MRPISRDGDYMLMLIDGEQEQCGFIQPARDGKLYIEFTHWLDFSVEELRAIVVEFERAEKERRRCEE